MKEGEEIPRRPDKKADDKTSHERRKNQGVPTGEKKKKDLSANMSTEELCKAHRIPFKNATKKYIGQTTLMFFGAHSKEELGINIEAEVNRFFDDSSKKSRKRPTFTILMGGVCVGKTRLRREKYSHGYVLLDAAEIFLSLCKGKYLDFPSIHEKSMNKIGLSIALRAIKEKRNIVTEIIGANFEEMQMLIGAIESAGYKIKLVPLLGDIAETWERNVKRGINNISAFYCEGYHMMWILGAVRHLQSPMDSEQT